MATTQLSDIYNPLTFMRRAQEAETAKNVLLNNGIAVPSAEIAAMASTGGTKGSFVASKPLEFNEPDYVNDNPADLSVADKTGQLSMDWMIAKQHKSWSAMSFASELSMSNLKPLDSIISNVAGYWNKVNNTRITRTCMGVFADSVANHDSDMGITIATDAAGAIGASQKISPEAIIDARQTWGDSIGTAKVIAMHSVVYANLVKQGYIDTVRDSDNNVLFRTYGDLVVLVDDNMPTEQGTNRVTYTSVLFGGGALSTASGRVDKPTNLEFDSKAGNGGGEEVIHYRRSDILHPNGYSFTADAVAGETATWAELANAANYERKWDRKNIPLAFLKTNG